MIVATGYDGSKLINETEIFNWEGQDEICYLPDYPIGISAAVGGVANNIEYICGGSNSQVTNQCFDVISGKEAPFSLLQERWFASSVSIDNRIYVFGGR